MTEATPRNLAYRELELDTPDQVWDAANALKAEGYRGRIEFFPEIDAADGAPWKWQLECNSPGIGAVSISATIGDVIVKVGNAPWEAMTQAERDLRYGGGS